MTTTPKLCGTCKHVDYSKTTTSKLWVECKLTGKRTALFTATCERWIGHLQYSKSIIEQAALAHFEELADDEKVSSALWNVVSMANKRIKGNPKESEIFGQYFSRNPIPPHHLYYYAVIVDWIMTGKLTGFRICLGEEPSADAEVDENNKKLSKLQEVLSAEFSGGKGDCDGIVTWNKPMEMNMRVDGKEIARIIKPAGNAPLEVGYTSFVRTHDHLLTEGVLARWPYGHKNIYVMSLNGDSAAERLEDMFSIKLLEASGSANDTLD